MAGNIKKIVLQNFKAFNGVNEIMLPPKNRTTFCLNLRYN